MSIIKDTRTLSMQEEVKDDLKKDSKFQSVADH